MRHFKKNYINLPIVGEEEGEEGGSSTEEKNI
jgi:hypothetical protein